MQTVTEINAALEALVVQMTEKGVVTPEAYFTIKGSGRSYVTFWSCAHRPAFDGKYIDHTTDKDSIEETFAAASAFIAALPCPEGAVAHEYLKRVASAVDYATENSLPDEYVEPLRGVTCALTDNLLTYSEA